MVKAFENEPDNRQWIAWLLREAGSMPFVREYFIHYVKEHWSKDEQVTSKILDILWCSQNYSELASVYHEIADMAVNEELSQWYKSVIKIEASTHSYQNKNINDE